MNYKDLKFSDFVNIPKGDKITAKTLELDIKIEYKIYIFSELDGVFSCLLPTNNIHNKLPEINGIAIKYQLFGEPGLKKKNYILLECNTKAYLPNFTEILKEIISEYDNSSSELINIINKTISKWRHFLAQPSSIILIEDEIIGLIGELFLLSKLIIAKCKNALSIWTAESGEEDFINQSKVIEVKTSLKNKHEHIINGIDQLLIINGREKKLLSLLLTPTTSENSITLPGIINECSELLKNDPENYDLFFKKLKNRGYDTRDQSHYLKYSYVYNRGGYFNVDASFPKLTTDELKAPLNSRISKVRYLLDLEGLSCLDFKLTEVDKII